MKSIKQIIKSEKVNMGGIILDQPLPNKFAFRSQVLVYKFFHAPKLIHKLLIGFEIL